MQYLSQGGVEREVLRKERKGGGGGCYLKNKPSMTFFNIIKGQNVNIKSNFELIQVFPYLGLQYETDL